MCSFLIQVAAIYKRRLLTIVYDCHNYSRASYIFLPSWHHINVKSLWSVGLASVELQRKIITEFYRCCAVPEPRKSERRCQELQTWFLWTKQKSPWGNQISKHLIWILSKGMAPSLPSNKFNLIFCLCIARINVILHRVFARQIQSCIPYPSYQMHHKTTIRDFVSCSAVNKKKCYMKDGCRKKSFSQRKQQDKLITSQKILKWQCNQQSSFI